MLLIDISTQYDVSCTMNPGIDAYFAHTINHVHLQENIGRIEVHLQICIQHCSALSAPLLSLTNNRDSQ